MVLLTTEQFCSSDIIFGNIFCNLFANILVKILYSRHNNEIGRQFLSGLSLDNLCQFLGIKIIIAWFIVRFFPYCYIWCVMCSDFFLIWIFYCSWLSFISVCRLPVIIFYIIWLLNVCILCFAYVSINLSWGFLFLFIVCI